MKDCKNKSTYASKNQQKFSLMSEIATLYYLRDMSQQDIANTLFLSRPSVSRLLQQARNDGIVQIEVKYYYEREYYLEEVFKSHFDVKDVRILRNNKSPGIKQIHAIGHLAADVFSEIVKPNMVLGLSWGRYVTATVDALPENARGPLTIVQIMGASESDVGDSSKNVSGAQALINKVSNIYGGDIRYLNAPMYVEDDFVCESLKRNPMISSTLAMADKLDIVLTGIGIYEGKKAIGDNRQWYDSIPDEIIHDITAHNATGSLCGQFFGHNGDPVQSKWSNHCIGINLEQIRKVPEVIAVAAGEKKAEAIRDALKGKYITTLVTDFDTASAVIRLENQELRKR